MALVIPKLVHRCVVGSGLLAGNKYHHPVEAHELEYGFDCDLCGEKLATPEQAIFYIYARLTELTEGELE